MLHEAWSNHEVWVYECQNCGRTWDEEFEVRHVADGHGGEAVAYEHDGHSCTTPWTEHLCPDCQRARVRAWPAPWRRHHAVPPTRKGDDLELVFRLRRLHAY
ncbi:hypothetical protein [Actinomadura oligospora]|uniref:hypothetical protein n=1 Tax=Actinomadura oligospora TaxID=111804 RepID=UPI0012FA790D|nr:hypothetical protein [Actinomadura oligospora]